MAIIKIDESYSAEDVTYFRVTYKPSADAKYYNTNLVKASSAEEASAKLKEFKPEAELIGASPCFNGSELDSYIERGMPILDEAYIVKPEVDLFDDEENQKSYDYGSSDASDDWCECNDCGWFGDGTELINGEICPDCGCADIIHEPMLESAKIIKESYTSVTDLPDDIYQQIEPYLGENGDGDVFFNESEAEKCADNINNLNIAGLSAYVYQDDPEDGHQDTWYVHFDFTATSKPKSKHVRIPDGTTEISAFKYNGVKSNVTSVEIPDSVKIIGYEAFKNRKNLESIDIPNSVTEIGDFAFYGCESLESIEIPDSVKHIGGHAFSECYSLETVRIGNGVEKIDEYAFFDCNYLKNVIIGNNVTTIGDSAFCQCDRLESIYIPNNVTYIYDRAYFRSAFNRNTTIKCNKGSYAEQFAKEYDYQYELIDSVNNESIKEDVDYPRYADCWFGWYQPLGTPGNPNRDKVWVYFPCTATYDYDEAKSWFEDCIPQCKSYKFCGTRLLGLCASEGMKLLDVSRCLPDDVSWDDIISQSSASKYVSEQMQRNPEEDGWPGIVEDTTREFFNRAASINYEIVNCVRGSYAIKGDTIDDLIKSLRDLKNDLIDTIDQLQADARHINESFDTDYSDSEVYQASSIDSLNNYAAGLGTACKDLKPGLGISVKGYYVERSDDGETYHVWNDLGESKTIKETHNAEAEDKFAFYFPDIGGPKILNRERTIKQLEFELDYFKNNSGSRIAGRGFGVCCLESVDSDTDTVWTGRYSSGDFLKSLNESKFIKESTLSISDLKAFYNTSTSIDREKYPNFFVWYDDMVRSGRYKNEALIESDCKFEEDYWTVRASRWEFCPHCCNNSLIGTGDGHAVCDSCGEEYLITPAGKERIKISELTEAVNGKVQINKDQLKSRLEAAAKIFFDNKGYDNDFIKNYVHIEITDAENDCIKAEVRAEIDYETLSDLADVLNAIVVELDRYAYFDLETTGIINAYIRKDQTADIPNENAVNLWSERFNSAESKDEFIAIYKAFMEVRDNLSSGTVSAIYDVVDSKFETFEECLKEWSEYTSKHDIDIYDFFQRRYILGDYEPAKRICDMLAPLGDPKIEEFGKGCYAVTTGKYIIVPLREHDSKYNNSVALFDAETLLYVKDDNITFDRHKFF